MTHERLTVERLGRDALDVGELNRAGLLAGDWVTLRPSLRWPRIATMRLARYRILLELHNQSVPQGIRVSWTRCHFGGLRALAALSALRATRGAAVKGAWRLFLLDLLRKCHLREQRRSSVQRLAPGCGDPVRLTWAQRTYARLCARMARLESC